MVFEHVVKLLSNNDENTCYRQSMCYQTVLGLQILLTGSFSNSMCQGLMEIYDKSASMVILAVFNTRQHVDSRRVF